MPRYEREAEEADLDEEDREEAEDQEEEDEEQPEAIEELLDHSHNDKEAGLDALDDGKTDKAQVLLKRAVKIAEAVAGVVNAAQDGARRIVRKSWLKDAESIKAQALRGLRRLEAESASVRPAAPAGASAALGEAPSGPAAPPTAAASAPAPAAQPVSGVEAPKAA